ncbi:hypothetical protein [Chryseobacterium sp. MP_3.2]|uniref:hypothetical protein n=1 Tax=Chryseobacterium sp. MP_3.2 TaxID=3071712 RepID=UPI002E0FBB35
MNKNKPEIDCHGKCQVKIESEKSSNPFSLVKYSFEFNILPSKTVDFTLTPAKYSPLKKEAGEFHAVFSLLGFAKIFPHPPQFSVSIFA